MPAPRKIKAIVTAKKFYGEGVVLFQLQPEVSCRYRPGQFLHLALDAYDPSFNWPESRVFSIANAPGSDRLEILVSQKGIFTQRMIQSLQENDEVWLKLPFGDFNFDNATGKNVVLIAGGTGISPFIPFLEDVLHRKVQVSSLSLFYGVRKPELIIYDRLLTSLKETTAFFDLGLYVESGRADAFPESKTGTLDVESIIMKTGKLPDPVYYLSGPKAMISAFVSGLQGKGTPSSAIFYDKWE